jgi:hypothetical protein
MTEYELIALLRETALTISQDFEFFVTATFAVILASYAAGNRLKPIARIAIAVLYLGSVTMFFLRYQNLISQALFLGESLEAMGSDFPRTQYVSAVSTVRRLITAFGTIAALVTLFWPVVQQQIHEPAGEESARDT